MAAIGLLSGAAHAAEYYRDLTTDPVQPPEVREPGPLPGAGMRLSPPSEIRFATGTKRPPLPLEVTLREIWPRNPAEYERTTIEVRLRNAGKEAVLVPISRDWEIERRRGSGELRGLGLTMVLTPAGSGAGQEGSITRLYVAAGRSLGGEAVPGSCIRLEPGDALTVRLATNWRWPQGTTEGAAYRATAQVYLRFLVEEEDSYVQVNFSEYAVSGNAIEVTMPAR